MFHKHSLGSCEVPHKIWDRSVQPFCRLLILTYNLTNRHPDNQIIYVDDTIIPYEQIIEICKTQVSHQHEILHTTLQENVK